MEAKEVAQDIFWLFFFSRFCDWIEWMGIVCVSSESDPFAPSAQTSNQRWGYYANLISAEGCHNIEIHLPEKPRPRQTFFVFFWHAAPLREKVCKSIIQMGKVSPLMEKPPITSFFFFFLFESKRTAFSFFYCLETSLSQDILHGFVKHQYYGKGEKECT